MIDQMTIAFYVHLVDADYPDTPSTIKFGSWDPKNSINTQYINDSGVYVSEPSMKFIRALPDNKSWDMLCN